QLVREQGDGQKALVDVLKTQLRPDAFAAAAENSLHFRRLREVITALAEVGIVPVVLKGAALAGWVYGDANWRTMSDVDLWVRMADMEGAVRALHGAGFGVHSKEDRPLRLQLLGDGEVQLYDEHGRLVEVHGSPLHGWWLQRTAALDVEGMWERACEYELPGGGGMARRLAAEDCVIQVAVHLAVNHQFGLAGVRALVDVALVAREAGVDWALVARRARAQRVGTAVWVVLELLRALIGVEGVEEALARLRPGAARRWLLGRLVSPEGVLRGRDLRGGGGRWAGLRRYLLLLLLVDRGRDAVRLVWRALWPERAWVAARYGAGVGRLGHLWRVVRKGGV
ncbi:MAG: nucleotidyltransferase family protein, partial [Chloroflexota bacterium]